MKFISRVLFCCFALNAFFLRADNTDEIVARIGETGYTSLSAAFSQVKDKETIILTKDIELESAFSISGSKTVTLNCGEYTLSSKVGLRNYTSIGKDAGENFCIIEGFKLIISGGNFSGITFSAKSTSTKTSTLTVEGGTFLNCELFAFDYNSKVTINGGEFQGGVILSRTHTQPNNSAIKTVAEINGGQFNSVKCYVRPYHTSMYDEMNIYGGIFNGCDIRSYNGNCSKLTIGREGDSSILKFENCDIYSFIGSSSYEPKTTILRGDFSNCKLGANNNNPNGSNVCPYGTATMDVEGGNYINCTFRAYIYSSSKITKDTRITINISGGTFMGGTIAGVCGDGASYYYSYPTINITGGEFERAAIQIRSCYSDKNTAQGKLTIGDGNFKHCAIIANGYTPECIINGGIFKGCLIGAHLQQRYYNGNTKVTVNDITANGCQFFADVKTAPSDSGNASSVKQAQANTYINGGTFIDCTKSTIIPADKACENAYVHLGTEVSLNGENVAKVGENFYTSFSSVIDLLNNNNNLEVNLVNDIFTPVSASFSGGIWAAPTLSTTDVQISNGKRVIINALGKEIDSNFSVLGSLILAGGYYTGSLETPSGEVEGEATSPSGIIYAKRGTKFPENPLEDESLRFKLMGSVAIEQNSDGDYEVVYVPGFSVRIL
ncbi:MAG: hypothetical protein J6S51_01610 [Kiritimatiellae bacterium]|nr:hypothetical protein [Kiritimatiellia bacterium]